MKKIIPIAVLLTALLTAKINYANDFTIAPPSSWVVEYDYSESTIEDEGYGVVISLREIQQNIPEQEFFMRSVNKPTSSSGLEHFSVIKIPFDPTSQHLVLHSLTIKRGETIIDLLEANRVVVLPEESNPVHRALNNIMEANIYLSELRINDVLEYSFTRVGFIPYYQGYYHREYNLQYSMPIERIIVRVLTDANKNLNYQLAGGAEEPQVTTHNNLIEYLWDVNANDQIIMEDNTPAWYNPYRRISLTTFQGWSEVVDWVLPHFRYNKNSLRGIDFNLSDDMTKDTKLLNIIRFVQDEVQNYTLDDGFVARTPIAPEITYERRLGDSRDKSLLLISLLQSEGVEAYPVLISTKKGLGIKDALPGNTTFDLCAVCILYNDQKIFIDPTLSNQGGTIYNTHFPDYKYGLLIKSGQQELTKLPAPRKGRSLFKTDIYFSKDLNDARMNIKITYSNWIADNMRQFFSETQMESLERAYLDHYYGSLYPEIETVIPIRINDNSRNETNHLTVELKYEIKNVMQKSEHKTEKEFSFWSKPINSSLWYGGLSARKMPYDLGLPYTITDKVEFHMPDESWPVEAFRENIRNELFNYSVNFYDRNKQVYLDYNYETHKSYVKAHEAENFLKTHHQIMDDHMAIVFIYDENKGFSIPKFLIFIVIGVFVVVGALMRNQY